MLYSDSIDPTQTHIEVCETLYIRALLAERQYRQTLRAAKSHGLHMMETRIIYQQALHEMDRMGRNASYGGPAANPHLEARAGTAYPLNTFAPSI
jgi:hypothetical protein